LQAYQNSIQEKVRQSIVGKRLTLLVDGHGFMGGVKKWKGRSNCNRIIHFLPENDQQDLQWNWVEVEVTSATAFSCQGDLKKIWGKRLPKDAPRL
jgi:tRNA-2-methylthio-N6-dimethylallyladenosine synthase